MQSDEIAAQSAEQCPVTIHAITSQPSRHTPSGSVCLSVYLPVFLLPVSLFVRPFLSLFLSLSLYPPPLSPTLKSTFFPLLLLKDALTQRIWFCLRHDRFATRCPNLPGRSWPVGNKRRKNNVSFLQTEKGVSLFVYNSSCILRKQGHISTLITSYW